MVTNCSFTSSCRGCELDSNREFSGTNEGTKDERCDIRGSKRAVFFLELKGTLIIGGSNTRLFCVLVQVVLVFVKRGTDELISEEKVDDVATGVVE